MLVSAMISTLKGKLRIYPDGIEITDLEFISYFNDGIRLISSLLVSIDSSYVKKKLDIIADTSQLPEGLSKILRIHNKGTDFVFNKTHDLKINEYNITGKTLVVNTVPAKMVYLENIPTILTINEMIDDLYSNIILDYAFVKVASFLNLDVSLENKMLNDEINIFLGNMRSREGMYVFDTSRKCYV